MSEQQTPEQTTPAAPAAQQNLEPGTPHDYSAQVQPPAREETPLAETPAEAFDRQMRQAQAQLQAIADECTQREWLQITKALDCTRQQIADDSGLTCLAMLWAREKHAHGGASWDRLLDLTDQQLEAELGFPAGDRPEY